MLSILSSTYFGPVQWYQKLQRSEACLAVGTATTATANGRNDVAHRVEGNGVARQSFYAANEVGFGDRGTTTCYRIGEDYEVATLEAVAIYPVHYHSGTRLKVGRKPALWNREDSEDVGVDCPYKEQCQH